MVGMIVRGMASVGCLDEMSACGLEKRGLRWSK